MSLKITKVKDLKGLLGFVPDDSSIAISCDGGKTSTIAQDNPTFTFIPSDDDLCFGIFVICLDGYTSKNECEMPTGNS